MNCKWFIYNSVCIRILLFFLVSVANGTTMFHNPRDGSVDKRKIGAVVAACLLPIIVLNQVKDAVIKMRNTESSGNYKGHPMGSKTVKRKRRGVETLFRELTDHQFRRMYRMSRESFWKLLDIIDPNMPNH
jgi:hypothetical protein